MISICDAQRIAIVDDDLRQAEALSELVLDAGFQPIIIEGSYGNDLERLITVVRSKADAVICDHRLSPYGFAQFLGAEAVARFYQTGVPAVLITQFLNIDADASIRAWRRWIPAVLSRQDAVDSANPIIEALSKCVREFEEGRSEERQTQRSIIRIRDVTYENGEVFLEVFVSTWRPLEAIKIPLSIVPKDLRGYAARGGALVARANTGAESADDLFFEDFEAPPVAAKL